MSPLLFYAYTTSILGFKQRDERRNNWRQYAGRSSSWEDGWAVGHTPFRLQTACVASRPCAQPLKTTNVKVFLSNAPRHLKEKKVLRLWPLVLLISTRTTSRRSVTLTTIHLTYTRRDRNRASTVRKWRQTAWTTARPSAPVKTMRYS
jgi:hypothetical protein